MQNMKVILDNNKEYKTQNQSLLRVDQKGNVLEHKVIKADEIAEIKTKKTLTEQQKYRINELHSIKEHIQDNEGCYIHNIYKYCYPYLVELQLLDEGSKNNIHIIRFIVLATYLCKDQYIRYKNRKCKKSSLMKIWDTTSRNSRNKTYDRLKQINYLLEDEEGYLMVNKNVMKNGTIEGFKAMKKDDDNITYTRLFTKNIQDMYYNCDDKKRKLLANLFKILPFISFKHNVFCSNPQEINEEELELLNWTDLARICGYDDKKQVTRFKKDMMNLEIYKGISTLGMFIGSNARQMICINPKIYYSGNDIEEVRHLYAMFKMVDNCKSSKSDKKRSKIN